MFTSSAELLALFLKIFDLKISGFKVFELSLVDTAIGTVHFLIYLFVGSVIIGAVSGYALTIIQSEQQRIVHQPFCFRRR